MSGFILTTTWLPTHWPAASTVESTTCGDGGPLHSATCSVTSWSMTNTSTMSKPFPSACIYIYIHINIWLLHMYLLDLPLISILLHCTVYSHMMYQLFLVINHRFTLSNPFRLFPLGCPGHAPKRATQSHEFLAFKTSSMLLFIQNWSWFDQLSNSICEKSITQTLCWVPFLFSLDGASRVQRGSPVFKGKQLSKTDSFGASWVPFSATTPFSSTTICSASCENRLGAGCEFKKYQYW